MKAKAPLAIETFHLTKPGRRMYFPKFDVIE